MRYNWVYYERFESFIRSNLHSRGREQDVVLNIDNHNYLGTSLRLHINSKHAKQSFFFVDDIFIINKHNRFLSLLPQLRGCWLVLGHRLVTTEWLYLWVRTFVFIHNKDRSCWSMFIDIDNTIANLSGRYSCFCWLPKQKLKQVHIQRRVIIVTDFANWHWRFLRRESIYLWG